MFISKYVLVPGTSHNLFFKCQDKFFFMMRGLEAPKMTMIQCWQPQKDEMSVKIVTFVISDVVNIIICVLFLQSQFKNLTDDRRQL